MGPGKRKKDRKEERKAGLVDGWGRVARLSRRFCKGASLNVLYTRVFLWALTTEGFRLRRLNG